MLTVLFCHSVSTVYDLLLFVKFLRTTNVWDWLALDDNYNIYFVLGR